MNNKQYDGSGFNRDLDRQRFETIKPYIKGHSIFEVGTGNGWMSKKLRKIKGISFIDSTNHLETYPEQFIRDYNTVICTNVLEHVDNVDVFLKKAYSRSCDSG